MLLRLGCLLSFNLLGNCLPLSTGAVPFGEAHLRHNEPKSLSVGGEDEFIFCGRLDNLCMSYCSLQALIDTCGSAEALAGAWKVTALFRKPCMPGFAA